MYKDDYEWGQRDDPISMVILFTNRNVMVFNDEDQQIPFYQKAISCYKINKKIAQEIANKAQCFQISKWREWRWGITKREFECLLGLRTKERDLRELGMIKDET